MVDQAEVEEVVLHQEVREQQHNLNNPEFQDHLDLEMLEEQEHLWLEIMLTLAVVEELVAPVIQIKLEVTEKIYHQVQLLLQDHNHIILLYPQQQRLMDMTMGQFLLLLEAEVE
jgi:hypothetical protein